MPAPPYRIESPQFQVIRTLPGSLGTVNVFFVLFDAHDFPKCRRGDKNCRSLQWLVANENRVAEKIDDEVFGEALFVLHATASERADPSGIIEQTPSENTFFQKNLTSYDSALTAHCLALRTYGDVLQIRTGFHHWAASDRHPYNGPESWESMNRLWGTQCREIEVSCAKFWAGYKDSVRKWSIVQNELIFDP